MEQAEKVLQEIDHLGQKLDHHDKRDMEQFDSIDKRFEELNTKATLILDALVGNEKYGQLGAIKRIKVLEDLNEQWKAKYQRFTGMMLIFGFLGSFIMGLIVTYIQIHFLK